MLYSLPAGPLQTEEDEELGQKSLLDRNGCQPSWEGFEPGEEETSGKKEEHQEKENLLAVLEKLIKENQLRGWGGWGECVIETDAPGSPELT